MTVKIEQSIWNIFDRLRGIVGYYNFYSRILELLFIKYLMTFTDQLNINDIELYKTISEFKRKYDEAKNNKYIITKEDVYDLIDCVEYLKGNSNVKLSDIAEEISFFYDRENQIKILELLDTFIMKNNKEFFVNIIEYLLYDSFNDVKRTGSYITGKALRKISVELLDVNDNDIYLDCFCGYSSTLTEAHNAGKYIGYEINKEAALVSTITCIMLGIKDFEIHNEDYFFAETDGKGNKVFADVIFGYKREYPDLAKKYNVATKDVDVLSFYKSYYSAKDNGSIVLAVPGKFLFSTAKAYVELRERITKEGLRAVISLPPLWQGTSIGTNLIYIDKTYHGDIEFVDATKMKFGNKRNSFEMNNTNNVVRAVKELWCVEDESNYVKVEDILTKGTWLPEKYVNTKKKNIYRSVSEIDDELSLLYEQLKQNM